MSSISSTEGATSPLPRNSGSGAGRTRVARYPQGVFWIGTIPEDGFTPELLPGLIWIKGQLEEGEGGFRHWQCVIALDKRGRLSTVKSILGNTGHWELTRSVAAEAYVWKDSTRVPDTQFEFGVRPINPNQKPDWDKIWNLAKEGNLDSIPAHVRVCSYRSLRAIEVDYSRPVGMVRTVHVYWGRTGTGKSRRAWDEAGMDAFPKDPRTKFWCGYDGEEHVVIDEFRGDIGVSHLLRWFDRYPVRVEIKGSSRIFRSTKIWITSNLDPRRWYPDLDQETENALLRRLTITHFDSLQ